MEAKGSFSSSGFVGAVKVWIMFRKSGHTGQQSGKLIMGKRARDESQLLSQKGHGGVAFEYNHGWS